MRKCRIVLCCLGAAVLLGGCSWSAARWRDFTDMASIGVSAGGGLGMRASATRLLDVEVMAQKDETFGGWNGRNFHWTASGYGIPFSFWRTPSVGREEAPAWGWFDLLTTSRRRTLFPNREVIEDRRHTVFILSLAEGIRGVDMLNIEVGVSALLCGLEVSVKPGEFADFFVGLVGLDPGRDDDRTFGQDARAAGGAGGGEGK
jgi:hypothetical protein